MEKKIIKNFEVDQELNNKIKNVLQASKMRFSSFVRLAILKEISYLKSKLNIADAQQSPNVRAPTIIQNENQS